MQGKIEPLNTDPQSLTQTIGNVRDVRVGEQLHYRPVPVGPRVPPPEGEATTDPLLEIGRQNAVRG